MRNQSVSVCRGSRALCALFPTAEMARLDDAIDMVGLRIESVATLEALTRRLVDDTPDVIVLRYQPREPGIAGFLDDLRAPENPLRTVPLLLVADGADVTSAESRLGAGATRVVDATLFPRVLNIVLEEILEVAPRVHTRAAIRLGASPLESSGDAASGSTITRTLNLSRSGILVETDRTDTPGTVLPFELAFGAESTPIAGWAEVVRVARPPREPRPGLGLRIRAFSGDGLHRYRHQLERLGA